jgi:heme exporter protein A
MSMSTSEAFVSLRKADIEYPEKRGGLAALLGRTKTAHSVLRDISFSLQQGQWITVFGEGGSGKTTLLRTLAGGITPSRGSAHVNGKPAHTQPLAAGYISSEESEPVGDTVSQILHTFGETHNIADRSSRIGEITEVLHMRHMMERPAYTLSTTERLHLNIARAVLSDSPLILLDDTADQLGVPKIKTIMGTLMEGRTVIVATRFPDTAQELDLPVLLLHNGTLAHYGTCEDIASHVGCQRVIDVWVEGLRYDLLRALRKHAGVMEVRLLTTDQFDGQRLRITLRSSRYLPAVYDLISQADLVRVEELPPSLTEILAKL